jgi:hypothetical protein
VTLDGEPAFAPKAIQDTPERRLADARPQPTPDLGLTQPQRLSDEQLQDLFAETVPHADPLSHQ